MQDTFVAHTLTGVRPSGERFPISIRVGQPVRSEGAVWACHVTVTGLLSTPGPIAGEDGFQALCLALEFVHRLLFNFRHAGGRLLQSEGPDEDFPLSTYFPAPPHA